MNPIHTADYSSSLSLDYQAAMRILRDTQQWLHSDCAGKPLIGRVSQYTQQAAEHAADKLTRLQSERPDRVHVLVLGEFKAGKSTLINALVGRVVAAVDIFEMTQAVCRIVPQTIGKEEVILQNKNGNKTKTVSLDEFLRLSQERKLAEFTQADVYVSAPFDLILVDTPGLGATLENENNALDALAATDVVLYTIDAENMGGARDTALLNRIQEINLPFRCILTKADVLEAEEVEQAVAYLSDELGIDAAHIFPVSAYRALLGRPEPGIDKLKRHLSGEVAPRGKNLREQAQFAQLSDAAKEFSVCITAVETSLDACLKEAEKYYVFLCGMAREVTNDLCVVARQKLDEQLTLEFEKHVVSALKAGRRLEEKDVVEMLRQSYSTEQEQALKNALNTNLEGRFKQEWGEGVAANIDALMNTVSTLKENADADAIQAVENIIAQEKLKQNATNTALKGAFAGLAGAMFFGPLGVIVAAPLLYNAYEKWQKADHRPAYEQEMELRVAVAKWRETAIETLIEQNFRPALHDINAMVAERSLDDYARNNPVWPLSMQELQQWREDCEIHNAQLEKVVDASSNARVKRLM